jgi:hypothetical protein
MADRRIYRLGNPDTAIIGMSAYQVALKSNVITADAAYCDQLGVHSTDNNN